eukprot:scaffold189401_cov31-Tisochrysis_lutea.AAC.1
MGAPLEDPFKEVLSCCPHCAHHLSPMPCSMLSSVPLPCYLGTQVQVPQGGIPGLALRTARAVKQWLFKH